MQADASHQPRLGQEGSSHSQALGMLISFMEDPCGLCVSHGWSARMCVVGGLTDSEHVPVPLGTALA